MKILHSSNLSWPRKACVYSGIALLALSAVLLALLLIGIVELDSFELLGHSGIRTLAAIAVAGCLLAAIGFFDE